jgi:predicted enzyme related to lactoylglutathione lyase
MLGNTKAFAGFSVDDIEKTKNFYGNTLGINYTQEMEGVISLHFPGAGDVLIYPKPDHKPATFTVLNFPVEDIEQAVDELRSKGISFEQYEGELQTDEKGIFRGGGPLIAWFKDPAGNILSVIQA